MNQKDLENFVKLLVFAMGIDGNIDRRESEFLDVVSKAIGQQVTMDINPILKYMSRLTDPEKAHYELKTILKEMSVLPLKEKQGIARHIIHMVGVDWKINDDETDLLLRIGDAWGLDMQSLVGSS